MNKYIPMIEYAARRPHLSLLAKLHDKAYMKIMIKYRYSPEQNAILNTTIKGKEYVNFQKECKREYFRLIIEDKSQGKEEGDGTKLN